MQDSSSTLLFFSSAAYCSTLVHKLLYFVFGCIEEVPSASLRSNFSISSPAPLITMASLCTRISRFRSLSLQQHSRCFTSVGFSPSFRSTHANPSDPTASPVQIILWIYWFGTNGEPNGAQFAVQIRAKCCGFRQILIRLR